MCANRETIKLRAGHKEDNEASAENGMETRQTGDGDGREETGVEKSEVEYRQL